MAKKSKKSKSMPKLDLHGSLDLAVTAAEKYADKAKALVDDLQSQLGSLKELQADLLGKYNAAVAKASDLAGDLAKKVPSPADLVSTLTGESEPAPAPVKKATAKKAPVKKATAKKAAAKKAPAKKTAVKKTAAKRAPAKKVAPAAPPAEPPVPPAPPATS